MLWQLSLEQLPSPPRSEHFHRSQLHPPLNSPPLPHVSLVSLRERQWCLCIVHYSLVSARSWRFHMYLLHYRWAGNNGPEQTDYIAMRNLIEATPKSVKRFLLTTSAGVDRSNKIPFSILNLFGKHYM